VSTGRAREAQEAVSRLFQEREAVACLYPELRLRVVAEPLGVRLVAVMYLPGPSVGRPVIVLRDALWQPSEVTGASLVAVVDWGRRALASWLTEQLESSEG